jgi:competence protein ComEA
MASEGTHLIERQCRGALLLILVILLLYWGRLVSGAGRQPRELTLSWLDQDKGKIAVEISGVQCKDGIYFFPQGISLSGVLAEIREERRGQPASFLSCPVLHQIELSKIDGKWALGDMKPVKRLALGLPIDVNSAALEDLQLVPGIGEKLAERIVATRDSRGAFKDLRDLTEVQGIKEKKLESLRKYLTVDNNRIRKNCPDVQWRNETRQTLPVRDQSPVL